MRLRLHWSKTALSGTYWVLDMCKIFVRYVYGIQKLHTYRVPDMCNTNAEHR